MKPAPKYMAGSGTHQTKPDSKPAAETSLDQMMPAQQDSISACFANQLMALITFFSSNRNGAEW